MLLLTNEDVVEVLTMERALAAVEESTSRQVRGKLPRWESMAQNVAVLEEDAYDHPYVLRIRPLLDLADGLAILSIGSWVGGAVERDGVSRSFAASSGGAPPRESDAKPGPPHASEKPALIHLFDMRTGRLLAVIQERDLQVIRVGAVAALNAKYLARDNARTLGLLGSGWMARSVLLGHCLVRRIEYVKVFSPQEPSRSRFSEEMSEQLGITIVPVTAAEDAVRDSDIVASATNALAPTFKGEWVAEGAHVLAISGAEYDETMLDRADVVAWTSPVGGKEHHLRSREHDANRTENSQAGRLGVRRPGDWKEYRAADWAVLEQYVDRRVYLSDIMDGHAVGRTDGSEITFSPSPAAGSSTVSRFSVLARAVYDEARTRGVGSELPDEWFHQESGTYPRYRLH